MPTVLQVSGHRFFFYSRESTEPPHIHVQTAERAAKFWLEPVAPARASGYNQRELGQLAQLGMTISTPEQHQKPNFVLSPLAVHAECYESSLRITLAGC